MCHSRIGMLSAMTIRGTSKICENGMGAPLIYDVNGGRMGMRPVILARYMRCPMVI